MASDRGRGLVAGYHAACQDARWVCDRFHEFQDLFDRRRQLERKAYAAIAKQDEAAHTFHNAKARPLCTSVSNTMNGPTMRVSKPWHATISLISYSIYSATPYTCVPLLVGSVRSQRPLRADAPAQLIEEIDDAGLPKLLAIASLPS